MFDFQKDVLEKSFEKPVLVDFWAPWCGPCRILTPVIEQISTEQAGLWELVKVNTEEHEEIANQFDIRSIPNVKLFYRGEVINEFLGSLSRVMILDWLKKALPAPGMMALDQLLSKNEAPSVDDLEQLMEKYPESHEIRLVLSQLLLWDDPQRSNQILEPVKLGSPYFDKASYLRDISSFLLLHTEDENLLRVKKLLMDARLEEAIPDMIQQLGKDNKIAEGKLSKAVIGIFNTIGSQHPLTKSYRKQLDMVLWA